MCARAMSIMPLRRLPSQLVSCGALRWSSSFLKQSLYHCEFFFFDISTCLGMGGRSPAAYSFAFLGCWPESDCWARGLGLCGMGYVSC